MNIEWLWHYGPVLSWAFFGIAFVILLTLYLVQSSRMHDMRADVQKIRGELDGENGWLGYVARTDVWKAETNKTLYKLTRDVAALREGLENTVVDDIHVAAVPQLDHTMEIQLRTDEPTMIHQVYGAHAKITINWAGDWARGVPPELTPWLTSHYQHNVELVGRKLHCHVCKEDMKWWNQATSDAQQG